LTVIDSEVNKFDLAANGGGGLEGVERGLE